MVTVGQFLERPALIPVSGGVLEGLSHRGTKAPPLLIIPPPPGSGGMDHPVCAELAWAASRAGHATLRFNFRGVGASPGPPGSPESRLEEVEAALRALEENAQRVSTAVAAVGASARTALELAERHPGVAGLALVSPGLLEVEELVRLRQPLLVLLGEEEAAHQAALAAAVTEARGRLWVVPGADARFLKNLPEVGHNVARWLTKLGPSA